MTTTDNTPNYKNIPWLFARWTTETLLQWKASEIEARAVQVIQINRENHVLYEAAKAQRSAERAAFRAASPKKDWPSALKRVVPYPPDLPGQWDKLIARREARLRQIATEKEHKREEFILTMQQGRFKAMQDREKAVRTLLNRVAAQYGLRLTEHGVDKRLEEMLVAIGLLDEASEAAVHEPMEESVGV